MKNAIKLLVVSFLLIAHTIHSQEIVKVEQNIENLNESIAEKATDLMNETDIIYVKNNGEIKYGSQNSITAYVNYNNIAYGNSINQKAKNNVQSIVIKISNNYDGNINLDSLNMFPALNFIYLIVENEVSDSTFRNSIVANNSNWVIAYQISLPQ